MRPKIGKRSLYSPEKGASNYRKAQEGRFADHRAFIACKTLQGSLIALQLLAAEKAKGHVRHRLEAITRQFSKAWSSLIVQAKLLRSTSDKLRFSEAIAAMLNPQKQPDVKVWVPCWQAIEMRTKQPSRAELRRAVREKTGITYSDTEWRRLMRRTGLNKQLATHRQKIEQAKLRNALGP
jgi:hypothetical protein